ncbi:hypothetical protein [Absidia glauca]|uniref:KN homeodomain domain-containing protein n=1 Tax=Absidia glauca TaxID=4829 RepID=A0A168S0W9_ABSGL|nr:hypothetical protein [Absidia glauca]
MDTFTEHQIRLFRPVILFHHQPASPTPLCQPYPSQRHCPPSRIIEHHKQRIDGMLKTNSKIWAELIKSTRQWTPPILHSPPPSSTDTPYEDHSHPPIIISPTASSTSSFTTSSTAPKRASFLPLSPTYDDDDDIPTLDYQLHLDTLCLDKRRRGNLPKAVTSILKKWLLEHCRNPYPTEEEKLQLKHETQLTLNQIRARLMSLGRAPLGSASVFLAWACLRRSAAGTKPTSSFCRSRNWGSAEIVAVFEVSVLVIGCGGGEAAGGGGGAADRGGAK